MFRSIRIAWGLVALSLPLGCGFFLKPKPVPAPAPAVTTTVAADAPDAGLDTNDDLTTTDLRPASDLDAVARVEDVAAIPDVPGPIGSPEPPVAAAVAGIGGDPGTLKLEGVGGFGFTGRSGTTRTKLLVQNGGNATSEAAVARGLGWLAKQQRPDGSWAFDGSSKTDTPAAIGLALLPFLAEGVSHRPNAANTKYTKTVAAGVRALLALQQADGTFKGASNMYSHAIATTALVEAFGLSADRATLQAPAQRAVNHIVKAQADDGSWGYSPNNPGDLSITGWEVQALAAAKRDRNLVVDPKVFVNANKFLDAVAVGEHKEKYGYRNPSATPNMTAVGVLTRLNSGAWTKDHPALPASAKYLLATTLPQQEVRDAYQLYYANQVMFRRGGDDWKAWNPKVRDLLVKTQKPEPGANAGSWNPDPAFIGTHCGRLGTTALALLDLQVYYRHQLAEKPDAEKPK